MKKLTRIYILTTLVLLMGSVACEEFERTLIESPGIGFFNLNGESIESIVANGQDLAVITIDLKRLPYGREKVTVTTNHGALFKISETTFDSGLQKLELTPFRQQFSLYIQSGTSPEANVQVVVTAGNQSTDIPFAFTNENITPVINFQTLSGTVKTQLTANGTDKAVALIDLGAVPSSTRSIELTTTHGELFAFNTTDFSNGAKTLTLSSADQNAMAILKAGTEPADEVLLTAAVNGNEGSKIIPFVFDDSGCPQVLSLSSSADTISIAAGDIANLVATLSRVDGISTEPITLTFSVTHSASGTVSPESITFDGTDVSAIFTPMQAGTATIKVRAADSRTGCAVIEGNTVITVTN